jgi:hypothetical protein
VVGAEPAGEHGEGLVQQCLGLVVVAAVAEDRRQCRPVGCDREVIVAEGGDADRQAAAGELFGGGEVALGVADAAEVVPDGGDDDVVGAECGLQHGQGQPVLRFRFGVPAGVLVGDGEIIAQYGGGGVVVAEHRRGRLDGGEQG